ncbi:transcriptional initiation protein Tat [Aquisalimonas sp.]|uniref:transcriptional initiation protein Tat n=1 Tax=Aquisalimonas sp. TaxID=1872621 RepID=UPI0025B9E052|nr:transcriptional initiation protein Tat [Aquisalimonas sp.]
MSTPDTDNTRPSRRRFLKTVVASGGAVALTAGAGGVLAQNPRDQAEDEPHHGKKGYHETKHIRDYYARADF